MKKLYWLLLPIVLVVCAVYFAYPLIKGAKHTDEYYMEMALQVAKKNPNAPFGTVIVDNKTGEVIAEGVNTTTENPTYHGEMVAINSALKKNPQIDWKNVTLYTTAEPCAMCQGAIIWSGISRVVFATSLEYLISHGWNQIDIHAAVVNSKAPFYKGKLVGGVLADKTNVLFNRPNDKM